MGGKRGEIGLDNYIQGSIMIYIDIIQLFIKIAQLLSEQKKEKKKD